MLLVRTYIELIEIESRLLLIHTYTELNEMESLIMPEEELSRNWK